MFEQGDQIENEFRNIKLKLKGPHRHSELQAVKALMAMSTQNNTHIIREAKTDPIDLSDSDPLEPIYGLTIPMTEEEFKELAEKEGIKDVIGEPICRLCNGHFSGPLGIALHMCPAMKRQTYRCEICGEDKWKTKANLHSHIKWCKKRFSLKTNQNEKQINVN